MERALRYSWILPGRLAVGERPSSFALLRGLGFDAVLSLQEEDEPGPGDQPSAGQERAQVPIRDGLLGGVPSVEQLRRAIEALAGFLDRGKRTYVHCYAGVGRSPTVCMGYLARAEGLGLMSAYERVASLHAPTAPTAGQLAALALYLESPAEEEGAGPAA
jgi:dual specificity protein phosphatase-like protein